jgi:hypothetical protein
MIIPNKYSGYQAGIRLYPGGGGGGGGGDGGTGDAASAAGGAAGPGASGTGNGTAAGGGDSGSAGGDGFNTPYVPPVTNTGSGGGFTTPTPWNAGAGAGVNRQPVYQPQYQNYNMGNPMSVSQYGQQRSFGGFGGGFMPQMQTPFNPYTNNFGGGFGGMGSYGQQMQMQTPFSFQQPSYQPQMQMQPSYQQPVQAYQSPFARSSGPSQAIVSRSSQMRGTPNVMRRAGGGIMSLMDDE